MSSISVTHKKRGRPATGKNPHLSIRVDPEIIHAVETYRSNENGNLNQSEAIRRILKDWLTEKGYLATNKD